MEKEEFVSRIYSKNYIQKVIKRVKQLGIKDKSDPYDLILARLISSIMVFIVIIFVSDLGYILAPIITIIYYYLFNKIVIDNKLKNRTIKLENEAMHFFEVLTLSLETGRNLQEAIDVTVESSSGELNDEFKEVLREVKFGKSLTEAMEDMQENIPSDTIRNIILSLTQADLYGSSIIKSLYNQIDYLREKRRMEVKGEISKIPIKISIISVFFFIPLVLIIILGPVVLQYIGG